MTNAATFIVSPPCFCRLFYALSISLDYISLVKMCVCHVGCVEIATFYNVIINTNMNKELIVSKSRLSNALFARN